MATTTLIYQFGGFDLDPAARLLTRDGVRVHLSEPHLSVLIELVVNAPHLVLRPDLAKAGWGADTSDNNIQQAISRIRKALGDTDGSIFFEAVSNRGYRLSAYVAQVDRSDVITALGTGAAPVRALVRGLEELKTLNRRSIEHACRDFEQTLEGTPNDAQAHAALGYGCALLFEASRVDAVCDLGLVTRALHHSRRATTLDPALADAWAALGLALALNGQSKEAAVAAVNAVKIDRQSWRHWLRLSYVSWGDDRIDASQMSLKLRPDTPFAYWLMATALIGRGASDAALAHVCAGCAAQDRQLGDAGLYPANGLHLMHGLLLMDQGRLDEAAEAFNREIRSPQRGQIFEGECFSNSWYALGAVHLRRGQIGAANEAFRRALEIGPGNLRAMAALNLALPAISTTDPRSIDLHFARSIALTRQGRHREAADVYRQTVLAATVGNAGWILPVEPILHVSARPDIWREVLALIRQRAS